MMDYEKAYKVVLQTATQWIKDGCTDKERICLECVFPELRESEDEKIRKGLIRHLEELRDWKIDAIPPIKVSSHYDAWIAYLEKQKEKSDYLSVNRVKVRPDGGTERYTIGYLEKQEQKPTWSEEDEKHINNILDIIDYWKATARFVSYQDGTAVDRDINWLKSLRPQPKQEWSEEDKKMLDDIIVFISGYADKRVVAEWVNFLKSLRPSWKPSEDEERLINTSISFLKDFADKGYENAVECIDWLKSKLKNGNSGK